MSIDSFNKAKTITEPADNLEEFGEYKELNQQDIDFSLKHKLYRQHSYLS